MPAIGDDVHFVTEISYDGQRPVWLCRAAKITEIYYTDATSPDGRSTGMREPTPERYVNLVVFGAVSLTFEHAVPYDKAAGLRTWHHPGHSWAWIAPG